MSGQEAGPEVEVSGSKPGALRDVGIAQGDLTAVPKSCPSQVLSAVYTVFFMIAVC